MRQKSLNALIEDYLISSQGVADLNRLFENIAQTHLHLETLEERKSDSLDFKEVFAPSVRDALMAAYQAGFHVRDNAKRRIAKRRIAREKKILTA